jgi:hypothetical protein
MMAPPVYSIDSSGLIHAWRRAYRPKNFPHFWEMVDALIDDKRLRASIEVYNEVQRKDDDLFAWCKKRKGSLFVEIDEKCQQALIAIMERHPRLVDTGKGRSGGDPFVIALAAAENPSMIVVTEEFQGKVRIPDVCDAEKIRWTRLADLIEEENWQF